MANKYIKLHIMKHALQHYINRDGASEKDIRQERKVLDDIVEELENFKEYIKSGCAGGCKMELMEK